MTGVVMKTYNEILSQPETWRKVLGKLARQDTNVWPLKADYSGLIFTGCGSGYYLSTWAARKIRKLKGWMGMALPASEIIINPEDWLLDKENTLMLGISRSGTTSETLTALETFHHAGGMQSFSITCYPDSELQALTSNGITLPEAQEISIAETRSFTSMMLGAAFFMERIIPDYLPDLLCSLAEKLLAEHAEEIKNLAQENNVQRFFFLGTGALYGLACEGMLKMKEMSLTYSEAFHFMEFRHGPMSMVDEHSLVIGLLGDTRPQLELDVLRDMQKLGARVLAIGHWQVLAAQDWIDLAIPLELDSLGVFGDVLFLPLLQLLAYHRSITKGLNPDKPDNLSMVVELEHLEVHNALGEKQ